MGRELFITDNPYRLLGVGSSVPLSTLRRKADSLAQATRVGLAPEVSMAADFGAGNLDDLPSATRALASDPRRRTIYRLMWPLAEAGIPLLAHGGRISRETLPPDELDQLLFLGTWYAFLDEGTPDLLRESLNRWQQLSVNASFGARIVSLLVAEDAISESAAQSIVVDAKRATDKHLLGRAVSTAVTAWESGYGGLTSDLISVILGSPIDDNAEDLAIDPLVDAGERLVARVIAQLEGVETGPDVSELEVSELERLAKVIGPRHPCSKPWLEVANAWFDNQGDIQVAVAALHFQDRNFDRARQSLELAKSLYRSREKLSAVNKRISTLRSPQATPSSYTAPTESSGGCLFAGIGAVLFVLLIGFQIYRGLQIEANGITDDPADDPTTYVAPPPTIKQRFAPTSKEYLARVALEKERDQLELDVAKLRATLDAEFPLEKLSDQENEVKRRSSELERLKPKAKTNVAIGKYNGLVTTYNRKLTAWKRTLARHDALFSEYETKKNRLDRIKEIIRNNP